MNEKDKVWEEMSKAWDKYIKKAREYCKLSTQFQCDAELLGYCIAQLPWDNDDIENVMEWVQQGADFGENQKNLSERLLEAKEEE